MKDIPMFTTEYGTASLILKEVPYRQEAYIRIQGAFPGMLKGLLEECVTLCTMAGAERIYASGAEDLTEYPLYTAVYEMRGEAVVDKQMICSLFPVTDATVTRWRQIYNEKMRSVDNAGTLTAFDEKQIVSSGGAYFVHKDGQLLGIGWMDDTKLLTIAATEPGMGRHVMHSLLSLVEGATVTLEVASTNVRAIRLYEKMGFVKSREISRWYRIK